MWLVYRLKKDGDRMILHGRIGRKYRLPELPNFSMESFCQETRTVYEFLGCCYHGHTYQLYRDITTNRGDTLAERYEHTMMRIEHITARVIR